MPLASPQLTKFTTSSNSLTNYDFLDIVNGLAYNTFYLTTSELVGALDYNLFPVVINPGNSASTNLHQRWSILNSTGIEFVSSTFTDSRTINGDIIISFTLTRSNAAGSDNITIKVYKNTTELYTKTFAGPIASTTTTYCLKGTLSDINLNRGDTISIKLTSDGSQTCVEHNPLNTDNPSFAFGGYTYPAITAATNQTKATLMLPYKIEI